MVSLKLPDTTADNIGRIKQKVQRTQPRTVFRSEIVGPDRNYLARTGNVADPTEDLILNSRPFGPFLSVLSPDRPSQVNNEQFF